MDVNKRMNQFVDGIEESLQTFEERLNESFRNIKNRLTAKSNEVHRIDLRCVIFAYYNLCERNIADIAKQRATDSLFGAVKINDKKAGEEENITNLISFRKSIFAVPDFNLNMKYIFGERRISHAEGKTALASIFFMLYRSRPYTMSNCSEMNNSVFPSNILNNNINIPINILIT